MTRTHPHVDLLHEFHRGRLSRNRAFERFQDPTVRRTWRLYRTLWSLARDLAEPGTRVRVRDHGNPAGRALVVERPCHRYRRVVLVPDWALGFWLAHLAPHPRPDLQTLVTRP